MSFVETTTVFFGLEPFLLALPGGVSVVFRTSSWLLRSSNLNPYKHNTQIYSNILIPFINSVNYRILINLDRLATLTVLKGLEAVEINSFGICCFVGVLPVAGREEYEVERTSRRSHLSELICDSNVLTLDRSIAITWTS